MKHITKYWSALILSGFILSNSLSSFAGNEDRTGQAGASELLINPWARSAGLGGANSASAVGLEATYLNVAGIAHTKKTEFAFSHSYYLKGTDISINSFGLTQKVGESGVIGLGIMSMNFGDIMITTPELPEGGIGTFSPRMMNIGVSYAKAFSASIFGGINVKIISEGISNASAQGVALDAGIQYITGLGKNKAGKKHTDNFRFGIALKNVGPPISYSGDGFSFKGTILSTGVDMTVQHRSEQFELPSLINIGMAYEYKPSDQVGLNFSGAFTSNSFSKDAWHIGAELNYMKYLSLRGAYYLEQKAKDSDTEDVSSILSGPSAGFTVNLPFGKTERSFAIDYSIRFTRLFDNIHSVGARINI